MFRKYLLVAPACLFVTFAACTFDPSGLDPLGNDGPVTVDAAPAPARDAARPDAVLPDAAPVCPEGYLPGPDGTSWYRLDHGASTWFEAELDCEDDGPGTHLVVIDDDAELAMIDSVISPPSAWVGVTDLRQEDVFLAVTGEDNTLLPWDGGEPNDSFGEDCVELIGRVFNDEDCTGTTQAYVCECDGKPVDPQSYQRP